MKKLKKLKLKEFYEMNDSEMKNILGGYEVVPGTCAVYIPRLYNGSGSLGNYDGQPTYYQNSGFYSVDTVNGFTIHAGISYSSAMGMINGISGAKWCCDNCDKASWY